MELSKKKKLARRKGDEGLMEHTNIICLEVDRRILSFSFTVGTAVQTIVIWWFASKHNINLLSRVPPNDFYHKPISQGRPGILLFHSTLCE